MASFDDDVGKKKPLLYSDLFKSHGSSSSCHSSFFSGFTSPDFASSESEDGGGDFIAELTRQMAECMLQEDDEKNIIKNCESEVNEPAVAKQGQVWRGRRKKLSNRQKKQLQKANQNYTSPNSARTGSGMQALFLPGSGPGSGGTGVFLPRRGGIAGIPAGCKKKAGCSMVLVPTRVLQVLEHHFSRLQDDRRSSMSDDNGHELDHRVQLEDRIYEEEEEEEDEDDADEMQRLPQEWSY